MTGSVAVAYKRIATPTKWLINSSSGNIIEYFDADVPDGYTEYIMPGNATNLIHTIQTEQHLIYTVNDFTNDINDPLITDYRLRMPCETKTYELTGFTPSKDFYFSLAELRNAA